MTRFAIPWLAERSPLRGLLAFALLIGLASAGGCSGRGDPAAAKQPVRTSPGAEYRHDDPSGSGDGDSARGPYGDSAQSSETGVPPEITTVAGMLLGSSAEVVAFGDFAGNGHEQALVVNRIVSTRGATGWMIPGIPTPETAAVPFTRATVIERDGARWTEVLRCDEHLKNPKGFLSGTPVSPVTGWSVQLHTEGHGERKDKHAGGAVQEFTFAPLQTSETAAPPIVVKWNAKVDRYQAFDRANQQFLGEVASLEMPASKLR
jgi:hypothetical protein